MDKPVLDMRSKVRGLFVALVLLVTVDAQGPTSTCIPAIDIRKNTFYQASRKSQSTITCPVRYCEEIPTIKWFKINTNKWIPINKTNQITITQEKLSSELKNVISKLIFKNISAEDSGIYRCMISGSNFSLESHNININVSDYIQEDINGRITPVNVDTGSTYFPTPIFCVVGLGIICLVGIALALIGSIICQNPSSTCHDAISDTVWSDVTYSCSVQQIRRGITDVPAVY